MSVAEALGLMINFGML
ncbi:putative holin-like toxin, partial [Enterococcus faecium]